jgi:hypothetical protein
VKLALLSSLIQLDLDVLRYFHSEFEVTVNISVGEYDFVGTGLCEALLLATAVLLRVSVGESDWIRFGLTETLCLGVIITVSIGQFDSVASRQWFSN